MTYLSLVTNLLPRMGVGKPRKREVQKALVRAEEKFRTLLEGFKDAIYICEPSGRILQVNQTACEQTRYDKNELLQMVLPDLLAPDRMAEFAEALEGGRLVLETVLQRKVGDAFPAEITVRPFEYLGSPAFLGTVCDISGRKRAEDALAYQEAFESLVSEISRRFVALPVTETDEGIQAALRDLGEFAGVDRSYVFSISPDKRADCTHEWCREGQTSLKENVQGLGLNAYPWVIERILSRRVVHVPQVAALPPEAEAEKELWRGLGIRSLLVIPILVANEVVGIIGFNACRFEKNWEERDFTLLQTVGGILSSAIEGQRSVERLIQSEERLSLALQVSNEGVWDWNLESGDVYLSPRWFTMLGYVPEDLPETLRTWIKLIHPADRKEVLATVKDHIVEKKGEGYRLEFSMRTKGGDYVDILSCGEPVEFGEDGIPTRMVGTHRDITDLKTAEAALKETLADAEEARDKIAAILRSVADGLIVADLSNRVVMINRAAEMLVWGGLGEALTRPIDSLLPSEGFNGQLSSILAGEERVGSVELELVDHTSKRLRAIQARTALVQDREGEKKGTITLLRDVTRERELDRMKSEFISTAAHELRTPLTAVLGFSEILLDKEMYGVTDPVKERELLVHIHQKAEKLKAIVSDLLDLSRIQSGRPTSLVKLPLGIFDLFNQIVGEFQKGSDKHSFELLLPERPIVLSADGGRLKQVLENLLNNAVKFSPRGGKIRVVGEVTGNFFQVAVGDEGIGMSLEQIENVFDTFYRVDGSDTAFEGMGLGMAIVKNIIEAHGGKVWVESEEGRGAEVTFTMPLDPSGLPVEGKA